MRKIWELSRRRFLWLLSMFGVVRATQPLVSAGALPAPTPAPGYRVLNAHQVATLEAIADQIIPNDQDPGAREAGAVRYIDRVLAGEQRSKRPLYTAAIAGTDETSREMFGRVFIQLEFDQQTAVLRAIERGEARGESWKKLSSANFFSTVWNHVLEGFYGPPSHGGNKDFVSWKMVGFPQH